MDRDDVKDPLFMNIVKIAQLPLAGKKPLQIQTAEMLQSTAASSNATPLMDAMMQNQLLGTVTERKNNQKRQIQSMLEAQIALAPITPRTPRTQNSKTSGVPRFKRVDNFVNAIFADEMMTENWVSTH